MTTTKQHKYETLDAMRGIAAMAVMFFHSRFVVVAGPYQKLFFSKGYFSVDIFFVLSGFVIALAYDQRLGRAISVPGFIRIRLIRLLPMIWIGVGASLVLVLARGQANAASGADALANALLVPVLWSTSPYPYALNTPEWSLFFELLANIAFAVFHRALRTALLIGVLGVAVVGLAVASWRYNGLDAGHRVADMWVGLPRVLFGFTAGVLLFRTRTRWTDLLPRVPASLVLIATGITLELPMLSALEPVWDLLVVCIGAPLLVALGSRTEPARRYRRIAVGLALISYPLYAIHVPLLNWVNEFGHRPGSVAPLLNMGAMAAAVLASYALAVFYDAPVRRLLTRMTSGPVSRSRREPGRSNG